MRNGIVVWAIAVLMVGCGGQGQAPSDSDQGDTNAGAGQDGAQYEAAPPEGGDSSEPTSGETSFVRNIGPEEAVKLVEAESQVTVLDVRTPGEYANGHIEGAKNIDFRASDFKAQMGKLDKEEPYLVHCASGGRSSQARKMMKAMGFEKIYHLEGGMQAWQQAGKPVVKPNEQE